MQKMDKPKTLDLDKLTEQMLASLLQLKDDSGKFKGAVLSRGDIDYTDFWTWEWPQGVALYGIYKRYVLEKNSQDLEILQRWFANHQADKIEKNVNTAAPLLTLLGLYEITGQESYLEICQDWLTWILEQLPKTLEGGFQHIVSERANDGQLWDDTIMMLVLFVLKYGVMFERSDLIQLACYQVLLHSKYLLDTKTNLWYHGWTFEGRHNFAQALWCRGNAWITLVLPEIIELLPSGCLKQYFQNLHIYQIEALLKVQDKKTGMWHTLLDDPDSYLEMSGSVAMAAGILKAQRLGYLTLDKADFDYSVLLQSLEANLDASGLVHPVSYGTPMGDTLDFYRQIPITPMPYGQSLSLLFLVEIKTYLQAKKDLSSLK